MSMTNEQIQALHQNIGVLRAMASNCAAVRHCWDHLDGKAVSIAADGIDALLAERDADKALIAEQESTLEREREKSRRMASRITELEARTNEAWIAHDGLSRPQALGANDLVYLKTRAQELSIPYPVGKAIGWFHSGGDMDIVAYKPAEARTRTVKLPPVSFFDFKTGSAFASGAYVNVEAMNKALAAAGITLVVGE